MGGRPDPRQQGDRPVRAEIPAAEIPAAEIPAAGPLPREVEQPAQQITNSAEPHPRPAEKPGDEERASFSRDLFLLKLVAFVLICQMGLYAMGTATCAIRGASRPHPPGSVCNRIDSELEAAFALALNTLLALLGGKAIVGRER